MLINTTCHHIDSVTNYYSTWQYTNGTGMFAHTCLISAPSSFSSFSDPGRILNRFSKDVGHLDNLLPWTFVDFIQVSLTSAGLAAAAAAATSAAWGGHFMPG